MYQSINQSINIRLFITKMTYRISCADV